jgi:Tetratrico peptide repeat
MSSGTTTRLGAFESAAARDSTGRSDLAVPLYRRALRLGLEGERRRRAVVPLTALAPHLLRYQRSVAAYARLLVGERATPPADRPPGAAG